MTNSFLHYWVPQTANYELRRGGPLNHIGSDQLSPRKVHPGDTIWLATVADGNLILLGRLIVGRVFADRAAAIAYVGTTDLWEAKYNLAAEPGTAEPLRWCDVTDVAGDLVFQSRRAPKLTIIAGRVNPQQLQSTRRLTSYSADLIEERWEAPADASGDAN